MIGPWLGSRGNDLYGQKHVAVDKSPLIPRCKKAGETEPVEIASKSCALTSSGRTELIWAIISPQKDVPRGAVHDDKQRNMSNIFQRNEFNM